MTALEDTRSNTAFLVLFFHPLPSNMYAMELKIIYSWSELKRDLVHKVLTNNHQLLQTDYIYICEIALQVLEKYSNMTLHNPKLYKKQKKTMTKINIYFIVKIRDMPHTSFMNKMLNKLKI